MTPSLKQKFLKHRLLPIPQDPLEKSQLLCTHRTLTFHHGLVLVLLCWMACLTIFSCSHDPLPLFEEPEPIDTTAAPTGLDPSCDSNLIYFNRDILPIFRSSCAITGCHDAKTAEQGYILTDYAHIVNKGLVKGIPNSSKIYEVISTSQSKEVMPPSPYNRLTSKKIGLISQWIAGGLSSDTCAAIAVSDCDTAEISFSKNILPLFDGYCTGCHGSITSYSGIRLDGYKFVIEALNTGRLIGSLNWEAGYIKMPLDLPPLLGCDLKKIEIWARKGKVNN